VGSCFTLSLVAARAGTAAEADTDRLPPAADELNQRARAIDAQARRMLPASASVLYVEDEPTNAVLMRAVVEGTGASMRQASTAEQGLAMARELPPTVMLIDLNLPDKDGYWLLQAVRAEHRLVGTHCVAVTADAMRETLVRAREAGFDQCWTKPLDLRWTDRALRAAVECALSGVRRHALRFDDPAALRVLAGAPPVWLDTLDFGVVRLDPSLVATAYNLHEMLHTGYEPAAVIGRPFFRDVGMCMDNPLVAGRLAEAVALDTTFDYIFRLRLRREPVRLRLLVDPALPHRFLLVDWLR
jgi:photoactive yellow protein